MSIQYYGLCSHGKSWYLSVVDAWWKGDWEALYWEIYIFGAKFMQLYGNLAFLEMKTVNILGNLTYFLRKESFSNSGHGKVTRVPRHWGNTGKHTVYFIFPDREYFFYDFENSVHVKISQLVLYCNFRKSSLFMTGIFFILEIWPHILYPLFSVRFVVQ